MRLKELGGVSYVLDVSYQFNKPFDNRVHLFGLGAHFFGSTGRFFGIGSVFLYHVVHCSHRKIHLLYTLRLLMGSRRDFAHQLGHLGRTLAYL